MLLTELFSNTKIFEGSKIAWGRIGNKLIHKYRCTDGIRQGRLVSSPADCNKPIDLKKRQKMRITRKAKGARMQAKRKRTMARNPASLRMQQLNKEK